MAAPSPSPIGDAFGWAGRIMAVGLVMVLPGVVGRWLDGRLETGWFEPIGFAIGFTAGLAAVVRLAGAGRRNGRGDRTGR